MEKTKIDWCDSSWSPVTGCLHGCKYCSAVMSSMHATRKIEWTTEKYGVTMSNLCVGKPEHKLNACVALVDYLNINRENILIVDDYYAVTEVAEDAGFQSASPIEVAVFSNETT